MIDYNKAEKLFAENNCIIATPNNSKRTVISFNDCLSNKTPIDFFNPKDKCKERLCNENPCIIMYYDKALKKQIKNYITNFPNFHKNKYEINNFISFLLLNIKLNDLWVCSEKYINEDVTTKKIISGKIYEVTKNKKIIKAFFVNQSSEFKGPTLTNQIAGINGAYIIKDNLGIHMIQKNEFLNAYKIIKRPKPQA